MAEIRHIFAIYFRKIVIVCDYTFLFDANLYHTMYMKLSNSTICYQLSRQNSILFFDNKSDVKDSGNTIFIVFL